MCDVFKVTCGVLMFIIVVSCALLYDRHSYNYYSYGYDAALKEYEQKVLSNPTELNKCIYDTLKSIDEDVWLALKYPKDSIIRKCANLGEKYDLR